MKKAREEMESELRSLVPSAPSARVAQAIEDRLAERPAVSVEQDSWTWGATALAVAVCVVIVILWYPRSPELSGDPSFTPVGPQPHMHSEWPPPTMLAYRRVMGESPDALSELLDRHAEDLLVASSSEDVASLYHDLIAN